MKILVNGVSVECAEGLTVAGLLASRKIQSPRVAVECNGRVVPRAEHAQSVLREGDRVEIVSFFGGG